MNKTKLILEIGFKVALVILVFYFLYISISKYDLEIKKGLFSFQSNDYLFLFLSIILLPINLYFEALKWKAVTAKYQHFSYKHSFIIILKGLSLGFFTPARAGDVTFKYFSVKEEHKQHILGSIIVSRLSQFLITFGFGMIGGAYVLFDLPIYIYIGTIGLFVVFYLNINKIDFIISRFKILKKYVIIFKMYNFSDLLLFLGLSVGRYIIFTVQFVFVLKAFGIDLSYFITINCIFLVYLIKSVIPFINMFGELGLRESASIYVFGLFNQNEIHILSASLTIWLINICIPSLVGLFLLLKSRSVK